MEKRLAIYIKQFENEDEHKYIYGNELDQYISKLTESAEWKTIKTYKDKIDKDTDSTTLNAYYRMIKRALKKRLML